MTEKEYLREEYLQKYLNWQKIKEKFKNTYQWIRYVLLMSMKQPKVFDNI